MSWLSLTELGGWAGRRGADLSCTRLFKLALVRLDLNKRVVGMHGLRRFVQHGESVGIVVLGGELSLYCPPKSTPAREGLVHRHSVVATVPPAVCRFVI